MMSGPENIWGVEIPVGALSADEQDYLAGLPEDLPSHEWLCEEMDRIWHQFGLDNRRPLSKQPIEAFYQHPVWLLNGIFSAADPTSTSQRRAIATFVAELAPRTVVDVGGGFGELALQISDLAPTAEVHILEPFPSAVAEARLSRSARIRFVSELKDGAYDVVIAQDVLEHVEDPIGLAIELAQALKPGGTAIFANNFKAIIQCHLPQTFHLRRSFPLVMRALGPAYFGKVAGAQHALLFVVPPALHLRRARLAERLSRLVAPAVETAATGLRMVRGVAFATCPPAK